MSDELETRPIPGIDPERYLARADGQIMGLKSNKVLRAARCKDGLRLNLWLDGRDHCKKLAVLIALAFHGPRPSRGHKIAFRNGNHEDTTPTNVYWRRFEGRADWPGKYGEACTSHRLTEEQATEAIRRMARGESSTRIAAGFGCNPRTLRFIATGQTWPHLTRPPELRHRRLARTRTRIEPQAA